MRRFTEYKETTNTHVYKRIHISNVTGCCLNCAKRGRRQYYYERYDNTDNKLDAKIPSWKLVSKNRKQWMNKPIKFKPLKKGFQISSYYTKYISFEITW